MANEKKKWTKTRKKGGAYGGVVVREEGTDRERTLLSPSQKGAKYSQELREGQRYYNNGTRREGEDGAPVELSHAQRSYRAGYLDAQKDARKIFKKKNPDYQRKTK